jgi:hypothetical protein
MTAYIPPSQCEQCLPVETITTHSAITWTTDLAHEPTCPNTRKDPTK